MRKVPLRILVAAILCGCAVLPAVAQIRLGDEGDRAAFRAWFAFLADAQFYRQTPDVTDCSALVRHAFREALRAHTPEWLRRSGLPFAPPFADVRNPPAARPDGWPLFRVGADRYAEFADASTIVRLNARRVAGTATAARPGDLLFFHRADASSPDHLMVFVGRSLFDGSADDWVVYHTGPDGSTGAPGAGHPRQAAPGEVRKVRLTDLQRHPTPGWRPIPTNSRFVGIFRLALLW